MANGQDKITSDELDAIYAVDGVSRKDHTITLTFHYPESDDYPKDLHDFIERVYGIAFKFGFE